MSEFVQKFINASRGRGFEAGDGKSSISKPVMTNTGLTDSAQSEQGSASDRLKRQRKAFTTVVAGETGNVGTSDKLGITGRI